MLLLFAFGVLAASPLRPQAAMPGLVVSGTLVDESGAPAAGVEVVLRPYPSRYQLDLDLLGISDALPAAADAVRSGVEGDFALQAPVIGPYRLEVRTGPPAVETGVTVPLIVHDFVPLEVPLHLEPITLANHQRLTVRALDPHGRGLAGALVLIEVVREENPLWRPAHEQSQRLRAVFDRATMQTDAVGAARFLVPAGATRVAVVASGYVAQSAVVSGDRALFRLEPARSVVLRVTGPEGAPAVRAVVRLAAERPIPFALTDEKGEAATGVGGSGRVMLEVEAAGGALTRQRTGSSVPVDVQSPSAVDVSLEPVTAIRGRISDVETGHSVVDAVVWAGTDPGRQARSDGSGGFSLAAPPYQPDFEVGVVGGRLRVCGGERRGRAS